MLDSRGVVFKVDNLNTLGLSINFYPDVLCGETCAVKLNPLTCIGILYAGELSNNYMVSIF